MRLLAAGAAMATRATAERTPRTARTARTATVYCGSGGGGVARPLGEPGWRSSWVQRLGGAVGHGCWARRLSAAGGYDWPRLHADSRDKKIKLYVIR